MKNYWLRNSLSLLLAGVMLLSAQPVGAAGTGMDDETTQFPAGEKPPIVIEPSDDETPILPINPGTSASTVLYSWAASDLNRDVKAFSSNLPDDSDPRQRWNELAWLYTGQESRKVSMHSFLNEAEDTYGLKTTKDLAGRTAVENLQVDVYPMAQTGSAEVVSLGLVYAHKPSEHGLNPANNGLLQVYVSADGVNWSKDYAKVRYARIIGSGLDANGKDIIYYEIFTEDLKAIAGNKISALRIMPDGTSGMCGGSFSLCSLSLNAYKTVSAFNKAVPQETEGAKADRTAVLTAYKSTAGNSGLARVQAAMVPVTGVKVNSIPAMLNNMGVRFADGVAVRATADVLQIFDWMVAYNLRTRENTQQILNEYEHITNTEKVIKELNRPQQIFKAYATCDVGDLLVQVKKDGTANVYMVAQKVSAQPDKAGNIDIATSTVTYVDNAGTTHTNAKLFDLYKQGFVPMVMDALADDAVQPVRVDANVSVTDQVRLAVSSNFDIKKIEVSVGEFADVINQPGFAAVYTNSKLNELPAGKYTMTAKVYTTANGTPIDVPISFEIEGAPMAVLANIDMLNTLDMNFYVAQSNFEGEGYYAKMVGPNGTKTILMSAWVKNGGYYQFTYGGLAAKQMSANITVTIYDADGNRVSQPWVDSIRAYVMRILNKPEEAKSYTMLVDMLNYGAAAQQYFGYQTDDLANSLLSDAQKAYGTTTAKPCTNSRVAGDNYYGTNFDFENRISMNLYFTNLTDDMTATVTFDDHLGQPREVVVPGTDFITNGKCKVINVSEIVAADGRQPVTCTIRSGDQVVASVTDSLESYVARMSGDYPWLMEIMKFSDSARSYLHSKN